MFSCRGLKIVIDYFNKLGHTNVKCVVPEFRKSTKMSDRPTMNPEILDELKENDEIIFTANKVYDDDILIQMAVKTNAVIVSNDKFRDFANYKNPVVVSYLKSNKYSKFFLFFLFFSKSRKYIFSLFNSQVVFNFQ